MAVAGPYHEYAKHNWFYGLLSPMLVSVKLLLSTMVSGGCSTIYIYAYIYNKYTWKPLLIP
jgi:hypothetical protein